MGTAEVICVCGKWKIVRKGNQKKGLKRYQNEVLKNPAAAAPFTGSDVVAMKIEQN